MQKVKTATSNGRSTSPAGMERKMFNPIAAKTLRNAVLALGAVAAVVTASPSIAGGRYAEDEVIYADEVIRDGRPQVRHAPDWEDQSDYISSRQISRQLRRSGYGSVREISLRGDEYRVIAVRNNGALVRLRLDAYSGEILSARRIGWVGGSVRPLPRHREYEPGYTIQFGFGSDRY
jgi:uncharacterized membrane protein YkoI